MAAPSRGQQAVRRKVDEQSRSAGPWCGRIARMSRSSIFLLNSCGREQTVPGRSAPEGRVVCLVRHVDCRMRVGEGDGRLASGCLRSRAPGRIRPLGALKTARQGSAVAFRYRYPRCRQVAAPAPQRRAVVGHSDSRVQVVATRVYVATTSSG